MNISDEKIDWFEEYAAGYEDSINEQIESGEIPEDEIECAKFEVETFNEIKNLLNETRKIRRFDGWEAIVPTMPMH